MRGLDIGVYGARGIPSTYSGYETFLTVLLPAMVRRGHQVTVYCRRGAVGPETRFEGVEKRYVPSLSSKSLSTLSHGALCALIARASDHDVVLVVNVGNAGFCFIGRWTGQPVVLNVDGQEWLRGKWGPLGRRVFRISARIARHGASALVADSAAMAHIYASIFNAQSTVIPYCWSGLPAEDDPHVLGRLGVAIRGYACIAGRLVPENNAVPVAEAYLASSRELPLLILGAANYDSPVVRSLKALAKRDDRLRMVGHLSNRAEFATVVRNADVYIHAHSVGGINPSLLEAMGVGALIYALDTPFNREAMGGSGRFFSSFTPELVQLLDELQREDADDGALSRMVAQRRVSEVFALEPVVDAYEALLRAVAVVGRRGTVTMRTAWSDDGPAAEAWEPSGLIV